MDIDKHAFYHGIVFVNILNISNIKSSIIVWNDNCHKENTRKYYYSQIDTKSIKGYC